MKYGSMKEDVDLADVDLADVDLRFEVSDSQGGVEIFSPDALLTVRTPKRDLKVPLMHLVEAAQKEESQAVGWLAVPSQKGPV